MLVYLFVPGAFQATEHLVHLVAHGDLAHQAHHADHHEPGGEHDCSGIFHTCLCHSSLLVTMSRDATPEAPAPSGERHLVRHDDLITSGFPDRLFRPPIA